MDINGLMSLAKKIRLAVFDVDGVMTDGTVYYDNHGQELKAFNIRDGLGIKLLQKSGVRVAVITGRRSKAVEYRAGELGIDLLLQGREDKLTALKEILSSLTITLDEVAYLGDDLPDLPAIRAVGLGMTVADGCPQVKALADGITVLPGGRGAVREFCEIIINAQGGSSTVLSSQLVVK